VAPGATQVTEETSSGSPYGMALPAGLPDLYRAHVAHLAAGYGAAVERHGYAALVVHSGAIQSKSRFDDAEWPFRPSPTFAHWLPLREADAWLVVQPGRRPRVLRSYQVSFWDGPAAQPPGWVFSEIDERTVAPSALAGELPTGRLAFIGEDAARAEALGLPPEHINPAGLLAEVHAVRTRKTDYERECLMEASRRGAAGHHAIFSKFRQEQASELELHLEYLRATDQDDHETPYKNIIAQCRSAAILHHVHYVRERPPAERSLLVDAGATFLGYPSDISRTQVVGEGATARLFDQLIGRVEALQRGIIDRIRPGLPYEELHDEAHRLLATVLRELELVRASDEELIASGATRRFFPHGLGHSLGIQVHDPGMRLTPPRADNPFLRNTSVIEPGQVFTIEPGLYFTPELMDRLRAEPLGSRVNWPLVDALAELGGVRIEDDIAVLAGGIRNLTRDAWEAAGRA
jgi:Xaa-Pro dipeptidase